MRTRKWPPMVFLIFSFAFIVVGVLSTLTLTCPICGGTGILKAAQGLQVGSVDAKLVSEQEVIVPGQVCAAVVKKTKFTYAVNMPVTNTSNETSQGLVSLIFNRAGNSTPVVAFVEGIAVTYQAPMVPVYVAVPAGTTRNVALVLSFNDDPIAPGNPLHQITVTTGQDMADPTCLGTGKLSFVRWIQAKLTNLTGAASLQ